MTSTPTGWEALTSQNGFKHHNRHELVCAARSGCPLCYWIFHCFRGVWKYGVQGHLYLSAISCVQRPISDRYDVAERPRDADSIPAHFENCISALKATLEFDPPMVNQVEELYRQQVTFLIEGKGAPLLYKHLHWSLIQLLDSPLFFQNESEFNAFYTREQVRVCRSITKTLTDKISQTIRYCPQHLHCPDYKQPKLPSRVVDIGSNPLRLHVSEKHERGDYIALSYCWGIHQEFITTASSLDSRREGFKIEDLPLTLQDAVLLARNLRFKFLWVDALCIVQDDTRDKAIEIAAMGQVYKSATVTISAANSACAQDGFLMSMIAEQSFLLPTRAAGFGILKVGLPQSRGFQEAEPLETRAWALQESLLSPRVLVFNTNELLWHCQTMPMNYWGGRSEQNHADRLPCNIFGARDTNIADSRDRNSRIWIDIVEEFTKRSLTIPGDRLSAIEGVASELSRIWNDEYLVGLWRKGLPRLLSWKREYDANMDDAPELSNLFPSWSWASVNGSITFCVMEHISATLVGISKETSLSEKPFASLVIRARLWNSQQLTTLVDPDEMHEYLDTLPWRHTDDSYYMVIGYSSLWPSPVHEVVGVRLHKSTEDQFERCGAWRGLSKMDISILKEEQDIFTIN
jgi:hypothetical protein